MIDRSKIDAAWTLFLDRDGVINKKRDNDYVKNWSEFIWIDGAVEAIVSFSHLFGKIVIVTNQQGIGKGLMSSQDLDDIHAEMQRVIEREGGRLDAIYHAPQLAAEQSNMRKPNPGMAEQACIDFPAINLQKSMMVGDAHSDMQFGRNAGISINIRIGEQDSEEQDLTVKSLAELARILMD